MLAPHDIDNKCRRKHSFTLTDPGVGRLSVLIAARSFLTDQWNHSQRWEHLQASGSLQVIEVECPCHSAIHDQGLSTKIGRENRDFTGEMILRFIDAINSAKDKNLGLPNANQEFKS